MVRAMNPTPLMLQSRYACDNGCLGVYFHKSPFGFRLMNIDRFVLETNDGRNISCRNIETHCEPEKIGQQPNNRQYSGPTFQQGVLRSNCIDCLDRTNVAQYAFGLAALGHQMCALGLCDIPRVGSHSTLAVTLMEMYENMGDVLAIQYGGSAAHNKVRCPDA